MNFEAYQAFRTRILAEPRARDILDLGETSHTQTLGSLRPKIEAPQDSGISPRRVADAWLSLFGLPEMWSKYLHVSRGVCHSLSLILPELRRRHYQLHLPEDVYPAYSEVAHTAGYAETQNYTTLPYAHLPSPTPTDGPEALLITNPLKPLGRPLQDVELIELRAWLQADPRRRLILDTAYTFGTRLDPASIDLFSTGQTILLHSLSHAWVAPGIFGVALIPTADATGLGSVFESDSPAPAKLHEAHELLQQHLGVPERVHAVLDRKRQYMLYHLRQRGLDMPLPSPLAPGYLVATPLSATLLLERHNVLAIPASVFGSTLSHWSILSSLGVVAE